MQNKISLGLFALIFPRNLLFVSEAFVVSRSVKQQRVSCFTLLHTEDALKGDVHVVHLHMSVESVECCCFATVSAAPLAANLGHPAADQQVASLIPLPHHDAAWPAAAWDTMVYYCLLASLW